jgi:AraC-like DNA-binding protein
MEAESFPEIAAVYGVHPRSSATDRILQESALHFRIRSNSNPFHRKILKYAQQLQNMLQESKAKGGDKQQLCRVIEEYKKLVDMAEEYELTESGVNIVLCTCIEAGSLRIQKHARIKQCIMDESHHCLEAESLMVFQTLSTRCERVVLLGDSRIEAVPITENKLARRFGLNRSLFHSLRSARGKTRLPKLILDVQHRMLGL